MAATRRRARPVSDDTTTAIDRIMGTHGEVSVVDILDHVLNKGLMATGDLTLGVAGVDLIYIRLSALLAAADRVLGPPATTRPRSRRRRTRAEAS